MSVLSELSARTFGRSTHLRERLVSVQVTPTRVLENNPARVAALLSNRSGADGAIGWSQELTFATGVFVTAQGGSLHLTVAEDGEVVGYELYAINNGLAGNWRVVEVIAL